MKQSDAAGKSAVGFPREALEELGIGEDQILFLGLNLIEEVQLPICSPNLAVASVPA